MIPLSNAARPGEDSNRRRSVPRASVGCSSPAQEPGRPRRADDNAPDSNRQQRLLELGRSVLGEHDLASALDRVLETARELTGARYAALGGLDVNQVALEGLISAGTGEEGHRGFGALPQEHGVPGTRTHGPRPLHPDDESEHPRSSGCLAADAPARSFLGVPILIRGEVRGELYLTDKDTGPFDQADEDAVAVLADWAAIAIENARLYHEVGRHREDLERAVRGLEASQTIAVAVGAETRLDRVLELIVTRGRTLVDARTLVILLCEGDNLVLAASAGHADSADRQRIPLMGSISGELLSQGQPRRVSDVPWLRAAADTFGVADAHSALIVPLAYHGQDLGVLAAFDPSSDAPAFSTQDEQSLKAFAASAATAVATAQTVAAQRQRDSLAATDAERRRWARELHDQTLQALGALRFMLASARRGENFGVLKQATDGAIDHLEHEIASLRAIITELRPAALDELGLSAAIEALIDRHRTVSDLEIQCEPSLTAADGGELRFDSDTATAIYRLVQESLTNVVKHADANHVCVDVGVRQQTACVEISDDGGGFNIAGATEGFGLVGMRERVVLAGGALTVESGSDGTTVRATLPVCHAAGLEDALRSTG